MSSLKQRSVTGIFWSLTEKFGLYGVKLVLGIILARILTPEDFGLIGMITVFFVIAEVLVKSGFNLAYVQKKEVQQIDADTIFFTNLAISLFLYLVLYFGAPLIADFYDQSELIDLTRVMGLIIVINAFNLIQRAKIVRDVNFKKRAKITISATFISGGAGITAAYTGFGVWALVLQSMSKRIIEMVGFWFTTDYKPQLQFSKKSFKELFSFGSWMLLSNVIRKIFDNIYILTIGKFFPAAQLGFYTKAKQFQRMASENVSGAIGNVAFPVYSKLQDDKEQLKNAMRKFMQHSLIFIVPILVILIVIAKPFVIILLKEKWAPMIPYLQLLCIVGVFYPINMVNIQAITAQGKGRLSFKLNLVRNALRIINIFVMYRYGVIYIILGEVIVSLIAVFINTWFIKRYVDYSLWKQSKDIWQIMLGGLIAGFFGFIPSLFYSNLWILGITGILITSAFFLGTQYLINYKLLNEAIKLRKYF